MSKVFFALFFLCATSIFSAERMAFIHMEKVFGEYYKTVNENIGFENQRKTFIDKMEILRSEYQSTIEEARKAKGNADNALLNNDARTAARSQLQLLGQRLEQKQAEIIRFREESLGSIERRQQQTIENLTLELTEIIRNYAKAEGIDLLMDVSGKTLNRMPTVLLYPKQQDISDAVIKIINAGHEKELKDAKAKLEAIRKKNAEATAKANAATGM